MYALSGIKNDARSLKSGMALQSILCKYCWIPRKLPSQSIQAVETHRSHEADHSWYQSLGTGTAVTISGLWRASPPGKEQTHELHAEDVRVVGTADAEVNQFILFSLVMENWTESDADLPSSEEVP